MTQFKAIEATPENIRMLQGKLNTVDAIAQDAERLIKALTASIRLMAQQPDSEDLRLQICELCNAINSAASDAMNSVNVEAEEAGASFIDEERWSLNRRLREASRTSTTSRLSDH